MIISNLDALLRERHLKISKVASDTRISRTTLTALCNNAGKGIQFDTANTLCIYLGIGMEQLFTTLPYEITVEGSAVCPSNEPFPDWEADVQLKYYDRKRTEFPIIKAYMEIISYDENPYEQDTFCDIRIALPEIVDGSSDEHGNSEEENALLISVFQNMPPIALQIVKERIGRELIAGVSVDGRKVERFYVELCGKLGSKG